MFSHLMIGANDLEASKKFYDATLAVFGHEPGVYDEHGRVFYFTPKGILALTKPIDGNEATHGNGTTIGIAASTPELVDKWHKVGVENGGAPIEDPPGIRGTEERQLYLAYLRDPAGNKLCATHIVKK
jgi:catechol 2,3-dioxygenase-like lactoylglutathione lyase family enzyme